MEANVKINNIITNSSLQVCKVAMSTDSEVEYL